MTHAISAFFVALAAFVYHEYIDPWTVSADVYDIWAMREASLAFEGWEHAVGDVHPQACVCLFCRNKPSSLEVAGAEALGEEPVGRREDEDFFDATDKEALLRDYLARRA
jgi:hypothetical protein